MAAFSKTHLKDKDWKEIGLRISAGETKRGLAREYGVDERSIRRRFPGKDVEVKMIAEKLLDADTPTKAMNLVRNLKEMEIEPLRAAFSLFKELQKISTNLALGASLGSDTFVKLKTIANDKAFALHEYSSGEDVRDVMAFTVTAHAAAEPAMKLLIANKATLDSKDEKTVIKLTTLDAVEASKEYARIMNG